MTEKEKIESALMVVEHLEEMLNGQYPGDFQTIRGAVKKTNSYEGRGNSC